MYSFRTGIYVGLQIFVSCTAVITKIIKDVKLEIVLLSYIRMNRRIMAWSCCPRAWYQYNLQFDRNLNVNVRLLLRILNLPSDINLSGELPANLSKD